MRLNTFLFWFLCSIHVALLAWADIFYHLPWTVRIFGNICWTGWITLNILHGWASIARGIVQILMVFIIKISNNSLKCVIIGWLTHTSIFITSISFTCTISGNIDRHQMFAIPWKLISINSFQDTFRIGRIFIFLLRTIWGRLWLGFLFCVGYLLVFYFYWHDIGSREGFFYFYYFLLWDILYCVWHCFKIKLLYNFDKFIIDDENIRYQRFIIIFKCIIQIKQIPPINLKTQVNPTTKIQWWMTTI